MGRSEHNVLPDLLLVYEMEEAEGCDRILGELDHRNACATIMFKSCPQEETTVK